MNYQQQNNKISSTNVATDQTNDCQAQFLEAFKELLELQNQRMTSQIGDIINQYFPHLIFPLILPTQIPNTYIINLGPFHNSSNQPIIYQNQPNQHFQANDVIQLNTIKFQPKISIINTEIQKNQGVRDVKEEENYSQSEDVDDDHRFIKYSGTKEDQKGEEKNQKGHKKVHKE